MSGRSEVDLSSHNANRMTGPAPAQDFPRVPVYVVVVTVEPWITKDKIWWLKILQTDGLLIFPDTRMVSSRRSLVPRRWPSRALARTWQRFLWDTYLGRKTNVHKTGIGAWVSEFCQCLWTLGKKLAVGWMLIWQRRGGSILAAFILGWFKNTYFIWIPIFQLQVQ